MVEQGWCPRVRFICPPLVGLGFLRVFYLFVIKPAHGHNFAFSEKRMLLIDCVCLNKIHFVTLFSSSCSFIHSGYFYSASSNPLLLGVVPDTARILSRSFPPKSHRPLRVKDLPKVHTWRLEQDSYPRPGASIPLRQSMMHS